ncbi:dsDNA nuclease domain-containing protein [Bacillus thuringiensis]|uniref:dsDNA nuclease domain-containing protein n=1 Tax=Bacillus thuringiensis TaxID=1428 RepID=UPI000BF78FFF|nr:dsDNA nuclease domain-containing protein [Bacillus thuringiensis]PFR44870.1 hypothetical protein COK27_02530 [Bacillus thuringiensis]PFT08828.1 hypothetical protein COK59_10420 [Bacillus thuringiensis]PGL22619.1 hypothetical protein CN921_19910 [Bacillus thuringiensis]
MTIPSKIDIGTKERLEKKLEQYLLENGESAEFDQHQKEKFVENLLSGRTIDLSGVTAIRGFVYQYYVAAKYLIDMLFSKTVWWDKVVFELLDDIALCGDKKIRFIQVKTKRESNLSNTLTLSELNNRDKKKGSWLDKLFLLNLHIIDMDTSKLIRDDEFIDKYELEFEIATNNQYNKQIAVYERDDNFYSEVDTDDYKDLIDSMTKKPLNWNIIYKNQKFNFSNNSYNDSVKNIQWYLEKFRVKRYGDIIALRKSIIDNITSNTRGTKGEYHEYKSGLILNKVLMKIVEKTCQDDENVSETSFVFDKTEFREIFDGFCERADLEAVEETTTDNLHKKFTHYFDNIYASFDSGIWNPFLKQELLTTMVEVKEYFLQKIKDQSDPYIYHRFLNRLFNLKNLNYSMPFNDMDDDLRVRDALKALIYCLVFYKQKLYTPKEANLLLARGTDENGEFKIFSVYNHRKSGDRDVAIKFVRASAMECSVSKEFNHDYYCLIADCTPKRKSSRRGIKRQDSIYTSVIDPQIQNEQVNMEDVVKEIEITDVLENIKFLPLEEIEEYFNSIEEDEEMEDIGTFRTAKEIEYWNEKLSELVRN